MSGFIVEQVLDPKDEFYYDGHSHIDKRTPPLSRPGGTGWKTGTKGVSQLGQIKHSVVVFVSRIYTKLEVKWARMLMFLSFKKIIVS